MCECPIGSTSTDTFPETLMTSQKNGLHSETNLIILVLDFIETRGMTHMAIVGYARVSSNDQDLDIQLEALKAAGCEDIFAEKVSGSSTRGREELRRMLSFVRKGDTLVITRIDRLGRSVIDLHDIVKQLQAKGVALKATMQPIDTSDAAGKAFFGMLTVFAEFETNLRRERQLEGIRKAKAEGKYRGRKPTVDGGEVRRLSSTGMRPAAIARQLGIGRASVYRALQT